MSSNAGGAAEGLAPGRRHRRDRRDGDSATEPLTATAGHPFFLQGRGWVDASGVQAGDRLLSPDGRASKSKQAAVAARRDARVGGRCRGVCSSGNHVHVDYFNRRGQISHTRHYNW
ncbi:hypothetical protein EES43_18740 [Streptomyces sp. ADI96-02]|uniref:hypothetical protein n=1 Tax=unclassified Streptomyces TaxID=2593676 RepID=UPI000F558138|nr:hypothetical protein [Streptomyces sp. ADI96-02]RPK59419.1 hypothetical protein EES43_18740 [Streptomyces sp. ADI96-02]